MGIKLLLRHMDAERYFFRFLSILFLSSVLIVTLGCDENNNNNGGDTGEPSQADIDTTPQIF